MHRRQSEADGKRDAKRDKSDLRKRHKKITIDKEKQVDMEKCSTAYRNRMYTRQKGTKSTSEYNKIAANLLKRWSQGDLGCTFR